MRKTNSKLQKRGSFFYKYVCVFNNETKKKKQIPIKLAHITQVELALIRKAEVEVIIKQLKALGEIHKIKNYQFKWMNNNKVDFKKSITFFEGYNLFMRKRKVSESTLKMNHNSLNHFGNFVGNIPIKELDVKHFISYIHKQNKNNRSDTSINIDLRILRTMLNYLKDIGEIDIVPSFKRALKLCPVNDEHPIYITEIEFNKIQSEDWLLLHTKRRNWYKEVYRLYWDLGLRLSEPFNGIIEGNYLHIPKHLSKNRDSRYIRITESQINTIIEMQRQWNETKKSKDHIKNYSKVFKKILRWLDIDESKHLHSLRHSYALKRRLETNGNYQQVAKELGHKSYQVTEKYQRCDERKLMDDFPSYKSVIESLQNGLNKFSSTKKSSTNSHYYPNYSPRQMN